MDLSVKNNRVTQFYWILCQQDLILQKKGDLLQTWLKLEYFDFASWNYSLPSQTPVITIMSLGDLQKQVYLKLRWIQCDRNSPAWSITAPGIPLNCLLEEKKYAAVGYPRLGRIQMEQPTGSRAACRQRDSPARPYSYLNPGHTLFGWDFETEYLNRHIQVTIYDPTSSFSWLIKSNVSNSNIYLS
jgi:hypothetical protein